MLAHQPKQHFNPDLALGLAVCSCLSLMSCHTGQVLPEYSVTLTCPVVRFSSVQLLGDLLFHISGVTGKMTTETASEDDNFGTAQSNKVELFLSAVPLGLVSYVLNHHGKLAGRTNTPLFCSSETFQERLIQLTFLFRPLLMLLVWRGGTGCWQGCTWAALTRSWWCARPPCTSGRSSSPTPPARCVRFCQPSSGFC